MSTLIAYGHSYVQGDGASAASRRFVELAATKLGCALKNNGVGGSLSTQTAAFDDFELADMLELPLSVVAYDPAAVGRESANLLLSRIDAATNSTDSFPPRRIVLPTTVVEYGREADRRLPRARQGLEISR